MSLKKKLQALVRVSKGSSYGIKFTSDGFAHATDNAMVLTTEVGSTYDFLADSSRSDKIVKTMTKDTVLIETSGWKEGGDDFDPGLNAVIHDAAQFVDVDPFVMKRLFDAVCQCWEGKKTDAMVRLTYFPETKCVKVLGLGQSVLAVAKPVVPLK